MNSQNKIIFLIGRENWQKDNALNHILFDYLKKTKNEIVWEDPAGNLLYRLNKFENHLKWLPNYIKRINHRFTLILYLFFHWSYFNYLSDRKKPCTKLRAEMLKQSILRLGNKKEIIIVSRSAGGRFSSLIADDLKIKHIICLSYPFKHPEKEIEPERYLHLISLKTPMLIIQGDKDEYGGLDVRAKYILSPNIELFYVDANHDFIISGNDWKTVLIKIGNIIN
jgi:hypothetical protein